MDAEQLVLLTKDPTMFRKMVVNYAIGHSLVVRGMGPESPPPSAVLQGLVPLVEEAANAVVDLYLANLPASAAPFESLGDMWLALGNGAVAKTLTAGEVEAVAAVVLAERPLGWWPRNPARRLLGRRRDEALNEAYLRGIVDGASAIQKRLTEDTDAWARIVNEARAGVEHPSDLSVPMPTRALNREDYASPDEYNAATLVYVDGFDRAQVALMNRRGKMFALL
jgi:hypothetical protein